MRSHGRTAFLRDLKLEGTRAQILAQPAALSSAARLRGSTVIAGYLFSSLSPLYRRNKSTRCRRSRRTPSHVTSCVTLRHRCDGPYSAHPSRHMSHPLIGCDRCNGATVGSRVRKAAHGRRQSGRKGRAISSGTISKISFYWIETAVFIFW